MAVRTVTTDPKPSQHHQGFDYFYFNKLTDKGTNCAAIIPPALRGIVRKGFIFDDAALRWDDTLRASVLELDFDQPPAGEPALPADLDTGWSDHDHLTATATADPVVLRHLMPNTTIPNQGVTPATARKHDAASRAAEHNIDIDLLLLLDQVCAAFNYTRRRIGVSETPRAMEAQKLTVTALIPWLKAKGVNLSEEDEKTMNF